MTLSTSELTQEDVRRLLNDPSGHNRALTAGKIAVSFANAKLDKEEEELATDIFRLLLKDVEMKVREVLSSALHSCPHLPKDVAIGLAQDVESVSLPVLEFSTVLTDTDLIEIVKAATASKQTAVAKRQHISTELADTIIDFGRTEDVLATLAQNHNVDLRQASLDRALQRFPGSSRIADAIAQRPDLPLSISEKLVDWVSSRFREHLLSSNSLSAAIAADLVLEARERATLSLVTNGVEETHLVSMIQDLNERGRLTPTLILRALCMGDLAFFEAAIAELAQISIVNARLLIHDQGGLGLRSIYERAGLPDDFFPAVQVAIEIAHETMMDGGEKDRERYRQKMIERILTQYDGLKNDTLDYLIGKLNRIAA